MDGTLVDTINLHAVTWWEALAQAGYQLPMADIHRAIGMGSAQMLAKLLPADRDKAPTRIAHAHSALYATYWSRLRPLPAPPTCCGRAARGLAVVLASSAESPSSSAACRPGRRGCDRRGHLRRGCRVEQARSGPGRGGAGQVGVPAQEAVFTGDTVWDVQACRKAGVPCIGLLSGASAGMS